jgi:hypothetical protein
MDSLRESNPSHACEQVATGRWNPDPPRLVRIDKLELAIPASLNPALTLRAPMDSLRE